MLDTDTASYIIKGTRPSVARRLLDVPGDEVCISVVTRAELLYGVHRRGQHARSRLARVVEAFLGRVRSLAWDNGAAERFAIVATHLEQSGRVIGTFDTMIAAHALATGCVVVTNNVEHFSRVPGLSLQNWAADT